MVKWLVLGGLVSACWSGTPPQTPIDPGAAERARQQGQIAALEGKSRELAMQLAATQERAQGLERRVKVLEDAAVQRAAPPPRPARREPDRTKTYAITVANAPTDGPADAKVTLVVAGEYACPYCEKVRDTLAELRKKYGKDLRIVHRSFIVHPQVATAAAYASCAAHKQHKFEPMDLLLWEKGFKARQFDKPTSLPDGTTQPCWTTSEGCPVVLGFAQEIGLDLPRFKADMRTCEAAITDSQHELEKFGVGATPSFFINGRFLSGAMPIETFAAVIDEEAARADARIKAGSARARYYQAWVLDVGEKSLAAP